MRNHFNKKFLLKILMIILIVGPAIYFATEYYVRERTAKYYTLPLYEFEMIPGKPVIYLYPEKETDVLVQLDFRGTITSDYPDYNESIGGWSVTAYPDGTLVNHDDNEEYQYLFWEGKGKDINWDLSTGFVVSGGGTEKFLQDKLKEIGLSSREYNEFITHWYPLMKDNPYNLIHFAGEQYTKNAPLLITPEPDSILRVYMVYKPLDSKVSIQPQALEQFERNGFTVVEWGGQILE